MCGTPDFGSLALMTQRIFYVAFSLGASFAAYRAYKWLARAGARESHGIVQVALFFQTPNCRTKLNIHTPRFWL